MTVRTRLAPFPEDRGRARNRDGGGEGEEAPKPRLRSILRSSSNSQNGRRTRSSSFSRRVSFSEAVDVTVLSPPPSSSYISLDAISDRLHERLDHSKRTRHPSKERLADRAHDESSRERYQPQRPQRPPRPDERNVQQASRNAEPDLSSHRRALTRALSESPSRERGLNIIEESHAEPDSHPPRPGRMQRRRAHTSESPVRRDSRSSRNRLWGSPSSLCSDTARIPVVMSGGLSGWPTRMSAKVNRKDSGAGIDPDDRWAGVTLPTPPPPPPPAPPPAPAARRQLPKDVHPPPPARRTSDRKEKILLYDDDVSTRSPSDFYQSTSTAPPQRKGRARSDPRIPPGKILREGYDEKGHWYEVERVPGAGVVGSRRPSPQYDEKDKHSLYDDMIQYGPYDDRTQYNPYDEKTSYSRSDYAQYDDMRGEVLEAKRYDPKHERRYGRVYDERRSNRR